MGQQVQETEVSSERYELTFFSFHTYTILMAVCDGTVWLETESGYFLC